MTKKAEQPESSEQTVTDLMQQSSVEIADRSKGPPAVTVKAYAPLIWAAADLAVQVYGYTKKRLSEEMAREEDD